MEKTLEQRVHELEAEVETMRRKIERLEETVSALYDEQLRAAEALDVSRAP